MIRIVQNHDWVIITILMCVLAFIVMLQYLQRRSGFLEFFTQSIEDSGNIFPTWLLVSTAYAVLWACLFSQYIPIVPLVLEKYAFWGYTLNKFGFTLGAFALFHVLKTCITFFFYSSIAEGKKWESLCFLSTKFYFGVSVLLIVANIVRYYMPVDPLSLLRVIGVVMLMMVVFKLLLYAFHKKVILPKEWYYKILYICTLQFAPLLALYKLLFF